MLGKRLFSNESRRGFQACLPVRSAKIEVGEAWIGMGVWEDEQGGGLAAQEARRTRPKGGESRPILLTIAGFDPASGAGASADLKVFAAHGVYGMACLTALTVQSTRGVRAVEPVAATTVAATLEMLAEDVAFAGIKLGMLANAEICRVVNNFLNVENRVPSGARSGAAVEFGAGFAGFGGG